MKKLISLLLALVMVFSLATVAFADDNEDSEDETDDTSSNLVDTTGWKADARQEAITLYKVYEVYGAVGEDMIIPQEDLTFDVTAVTSGAPNISSTTLEWDDDDNGLTSVDDADGKYSATLTLNLPEYDSVGVYEYMITESPEIGNGKAVTYSDAEIHFIVLVTYDYDNSCLKSEVILTTISDDANNSNTTPATPKDPESEDQEEEQEVVEQVEEYKLDTFTNKYELGHLNVTKTVVGNLADKGVEFEMNVNFTSDEPVLSTITVTDGSGVPGETETISPDDWEVTKTDTSTEYTATANIKVKHGETVKIENIPVGVYYEVVEASSHILGDNESLDPNSATDKQYKVEYETQTGSISLDTTATSTVTNTKDNPVDTGITLDTIPFVLILAVCAGAVVLFVVKRRRSTEF